MDFEADARITTASWQDDFGENTQDPIIRYLAIDPYAKAGNNRKRWRYLDRRRCAG